MQLTQASYYTWERGAVACCAVSIRSCAAMPASASSAFALPTTADADASDSFDGASDTVTRAVYIALISWVNKGCIWLARGGSEKDLPYLIVTTLKDHCLKTLLL